MRVILLLGLALAAATAFTLTRNGDSGFDFDYSHFGEDSPIDLKLSGSYDKDDETKREITAFVNIFGQMFPVFEKVMSPQEELTYSWNWCSAAGSFMRTCLYFDAHLVVGWKVNQIGIDDTLYNITYSPFVNGTSSGGTSLSASFFKLGVAGVDNFFRFEVPISLEFDGFNRLCYSAYSEYFPYTVNV
jgi:hypothetical protein